MMSYELESRVAYYYFLYYYDINDCDSVYKQLAGRFLRLIFILTPLLSPSGSGLAGMTSTRGSRVGGRFCDSIFRVNGSMYEITLCYRQIHLFGSRPDAMELYYVVYYVPLRSLWQVRSAHGQTEIQTRVYS